MLTYVSVNFEYRYVDSCSWATLFVNRHLSNINSDTGIFVKSSNPSTSPEIAINVCPKQAEHPLTLGTVAICASLL